MKSNTDVFTTSDVAFICRVSTRIVTKWYDNGVLDGYRLPESKHRRFTKNHIENFMSKQEMPIEWLFEAIKMRENGKKLRKVRPKVADEAIAGAAPAE